jgi:hypothetical protein
MWDFVMDESGAGAGFLRELRFPLPIYIPTASPQSSSLSPELEFKHMYAFAIAMLVMQCDITIFISKEHYVCVEHFQEEIHFTLRIFPAFWVIFNDALKRITAYITSAN